MATWLLHHAQTVYVQVLLQGKSSACLEQDLSARHLCLQIPDIDAIIHTSDFSCVPAALGGLQPEGPPIFGYNSDPAHADVPFPDYSYWGHEYTRLRGDPLTTQQTASIAVNAGQLCAMFQGELSFVQDVKTSTVLTCLAVCR